jgi:hypothetical protein
MNKLLVNCSVLPLGSRGYLIPTDRKNPRFPAGSKFEIKKILNNQILIKFKTSNSIFGIMESESEQLLGMKLSEYLKEVDKLKAEGMRRLSQALVESGFFAVIQTQIIGDKNES